MAKQNMTVGNAFSLLSIDESDSDSNDAPAELPTNKLAKKKPNKKKNSSAKNDDLRSLAFATGKSTSNNKNKSNAKNSVPQKSQVQWDEWSAKDQKFTESAYEDDLQQALLQSKLEFEEKKSQPVVLNGHKEEPQSNKKKKKNKEKPSIMTLEDFNQRNAPKPELEETVPEFMPEINKLNAHVENPEPEFFDNVIEDAAKIIFKEKIHEEYTKQYKVASAQQIKFEKVISEKDEEISRLKDNNVTLTEDLLAVKKRCQILCKILAQGEMKEKAEILKEVEELQTVRSELTDEVTRLTTELEKVRSGENKKNKKNNDRKQVTIRDS